MDPVIVVAKFEVRTLGSQLSTQHYLRACGPQ